MKVISVGNFGASWDGSICDEEHIAGALEKLGHQVIRAQREYVIDFLGSDAEFTLIAQWDGYNIEDILRLPRPIVFWAFDFQEWGQRWCEDLIAVSDLYLSKRIADSKYPNWRWLSQDFAPQFLDKAAEAEKDIDVLFTGSYLPWATERNDIIRAVNNNFNLVVHSVNDWPDIPNKGPVMDYDLPELIARSKINLSIDHTIEAGYWSDRISQAICCGGFVLTKYVPMMEAVFRSHIAYYFNQEDCLDNIVYWLEHDEDREVIAAEAYEYSPMYKVKERVADMLNIVRSIL